ncbi:Zip-domain-containing protein [Aulographum hederae CBS 113979]|uniref:Zip-domain-containing protein n=1 Tax=Aulographum hederae CBS 113979 TaxID=1176131 RepID=A0A6G1H2M4_9PEZI|nr:Zip-domain-containing protein [Aulographum hederae CBS 113979]
MVPWAVLPLLALCYTTAVNAQTATTSSITAVSECHMHGATPFCMAGDSEFQVLVEATATEEVAAQYTGCHSHGTEMYCVGPDGEEVQLEPEVAATEEDEKDHEHEEGEQHDHEHDHEREESESGETNCHFHAGVEHCVGIEASEAVECDRVERDYNISLRVGLLFVILATSAIGVFMPILVTSFSRVKSSNIIFVVLKQFGTGVIISTAFVHLFTHASLMFSNQCLGELSYEATTAAILMAGLFLSFLIEFIGHRVLLARQPKTITPPPTDSSSDSSKPGFSSPEAQALEPSGQESAIPATKKSDLMSVYVLEAGILFHSLLIGLTLVVAADSFFLTLFAVILFHQMFEGIALGTRIAPLGISTVKKSGMAACFAVITPIGMAIGIGVLWSFNGNDPSTLVAIGTLDAFSAGILVWVGVVEMWAKDWGMVEGSRREDSLMYAGPVATGLAMFALVAGMGIMSLLGKWA